MSLLLAVAAAAQPRGLSLYEAQILPAPAVLERVLGAVGALYPEIERPSPAITLGTGFHIAFASTPRSTGYPGLCEAETITVNFGPSADGPTAATTRVQSVWRGRVYKIVGDTTPLAGGWSDSYTRMLAAQCASAGPVLSQPATAPRFFNGYYNASSDFFSIAHAYVGARALAKVSTGVLPPIECRDDIPGAGDRVCDDPSTLLRNLPMERFLSFEMGRCGRSEPDLCVIAKFSRGPVPDVRFIAIQMRTSLSEVVGPVPDFTLREIRIQASAMVD